jgi:hypothetical protein
VHSPKRCFPFMIAHSGVGAFSLSCHRHAGPACHFHPPPHIARSPPRRCITSPPPTTLHCPASILEMPNQGFNSLVLIPPHNPLLNPPWPSMARSLISVVSSHYCPTTASPVPIKGRALLQRKLHILSSLSSSLLPSSTPTLSSHHHHHCTASPSPPVLR